LAALVDQLPASSLPDALSFSNFASP